MNQFLVSHQEGTNKPCHKHGPNCWTNAGLLLVGFVGGKRDDSEMAEFVQISSFTCNLNNQSDVKEIPNSKITTKLI